MINPDKLKFAIIVSLSALLTVELFVIFSVI